MLEGLKAVDSTNLPPEGDGTIRALSRIGYDLSDALADLIDNSIDAGASRAEITIYRSDDEVTSVTIADDGRGMSDAELRIGMQFAARTDHNPNDLGAFGLGLKSASFSQCETLTVISRKAGTTAAARWSVEQIGKDWKCELLESAASEAEFRRLCIPAKRPVTGTIVVWDRLTRLAVGSGDHDLDEFLANEVAIIEAHLGLVFHRFLTAGSLILTIVVKHERRSLALPRTVKPRDPFDYRRSGSEGWPKKLITELPGVGTLNMEAHIWPAGSLADGYLLGAKSGLRWQGFYFYRNHRIIQAGGWNGVVRNEPDNDLALARVSIELPPGGLEMNVQKSALQVTAAQEQAFLGAQGDGITFEEYLEEARKVCTSARRANKAPKNVPLVPGQGIPMPVRRTAQKILASSGPHQELDFVWQVLDQEELFRLDLAETRVLLNKNYRREILGEASASATDAPIIKILIFLLFKDDFERFRFSAKRNAYLKACNALLLEAIGI
ncbi:ATP-binding protein [Stappia sp. BW2]|uniref:ATP-binding protein n=1 Tax=Stappia sp. BW2 TaxID=2592622 RepID=UPI0011DEF7B6|nr:ATP-binding protein [Stappia sp. BW2]TYC79873.1 ATP-binding protein [Stappia sp. BW2]